MLFRSIHAADQRSRIHPRVRLVTGVTASLALIEAAVAQGADAILVHHGMFWKGDDMRVVGPKKKRLSSLLGNEISVFAYHLPLDAHSELGNNAQLGQRLGLHADARFGEQEIGFLGDLSTPVSGREFARIVGAILGRAPLEVGDMDRQVRRIGWCTDRKSVV